MYDITSMKVDSQTRPGQARQAGRQAERDKEMDIYIYIYICRKKDR